MGRYFCQSSAVVPVWLSSLFKGNQHYWFSQLPCVGIPWMKKFIFFLSQSAMLKKSGQGNFVAKELQKVLHFAQESWSFPLLANILSCAIKKLTDQYILKSCKVINVDCSTLHRCSIFRTRS